MRLTIVALSTLILSAPVAFAGGSGSSNSGSSRSDAQFRNSQMQINNELNNIGCGNCSDTSAPSRSLRPRSRPDGLSNRSNRDSSRSRGRSYSGSGGGQYE